MKERQDGVTMRPDQWAFPDFMDTGLSNITPRFELAGEQ